MSTCHLSASQFIIKFVTDVYWENILEPVEEWALDHYGIDTEGNWNDWTFQQDSTPSHASVNENKEKFKVPTQTWLNDHFPDFIKIDEWPASSPDLNPLDYSIWSLLEADVNAEEHNSVESLKNAISEAFERLPMEVINQAVDNWMKRLDAVIKAKGGHFEWILIKFYVLLLFILLLYIGGQGGGSTSPDPLTQKAEK